MKVISAGSGGPHDIWIRKQQNQGYVALDPRAYVLGGEENGELVVLSQGSSGHHRQGVMSREGITEGATQLDN